MKIFGRMQTYVAIIALWTAMAISNSYEATSKEILANAVLAALAGMVIVNILIERAREEVKREEKRINKMGVPFFPPTLPIISFRLMIE